MQQLAFRVMHSIKTAEGSRAQDEVVNLNYSEVFANANSLNEAARFVLDALMSKLAKALSIPHEEPDPAKALHAYGVNSLMAVELRNWFAKEWNADVAIFDIMGAPNLTAVSVTVAGKSTFKQGW